MEHEKERESVDLLGSKLGHHLDVEMVDMMVVAKAALMKAEMDALMETTKGTY